MDDNGVTSVPVRVQFGDREDDSVPLAWAEDMLRWLRVERPAAFQDALLHAAGVPKIAPRRRP